MKTKLIILLSLLFLVLTHRLWAGCGKGYLVINNSLSLGYDKWYDPGAPTLFVNVNDSSELVGRTVGHCMSSCIITSILLNGSPIQWTGGNRVKIRNNLGLYEVTFSFMVSAITYTQAMSFYFSSQTAVGIEEDGEMSPGLVLAPNPASGQFRIESTAFIQSVSIFDITGKQLDFVPAYTNGSSIPLNDYPRGIYLVKVAVEPEKTVVKKLVVE